MQIVIDIPEEFGIDINDKFQDFFQRLRVEIKEHLISGTGLVCGAYELEIIDMFLKAFNNGTPLPKGYGRLIDADAFGKELHRYTEAPYQYALKVFNDAPTIIEADKE